MKSKLFTKDVALVTFGNTDEISGGYAVIEKPHVVVHHGLTFIEGIHAHDSGAFVSGKRILIPLSSVTSITEFDKTTEFFSQPKRKRRKR